MHAEAFAGLARAEQVLARPINPTVVSSAEWQCRREEHNYFVEDVSSQPKLYVLGSDDDLR